MCLPSETKDLISLVALSKPSLDMRSWDSFVNLTAWKPCSSALLERKLWGPQQNSTKTGLEPDWDTLGQDPAPVDVRGVSALGLVRAKRSHWPEDPEVSAPTSPWDSKEGKGHSPDESSKSLLISNSCSKQSLRKVLLSFGWDGLATNLIGVVGQRVSLCCHWLVRISLKCLKGHLLPPNPQLDSSLNHPNQMRAKSSSKTATSRNLKSKMTSSSHQVSALFPPWSPRVL